MERNDIVLRKLEEKALAQVQRLYKEAADKEMVDMSLEMRLPIQSLRRWLATTSPTVHRCM